MTTQETVQIIARLLGFLAVVQSYEFLVIARRVERVWQWPDLERELGSGFALALEPRRFRWLNVTRALVGAIVICWPTAILLWVLFAFHVLTLLRWLGTYNGGSDYMSLLLLWTSALALSAPAKLGEVCVYYIVFQLCLSYFRAGYIKLKNPKWRSGEALPAFINSSAYERKAWLSRVASWRALSWTVMIFEVGFPLCLLHPNAALACMIIGGSFHLGNAYAFGLNRFFWSWLAAYPALYFVSLRTSL